MKSITIVIIALIVLSVSAGVLTLNDLNDVSTAGATTGQVLTKTDRGWKAAPVGSGSAPSGEVVYGTGGGTTSSPDLTYSTGLFELETTTPTTPTINVKRNGDSGAAIFQMENTNNKWIFYASGNDFGIEPQTVDAIFKIRNLANANLWQITTSNGIIQNSAGTYYRVTGLDTGTKTKLAGFDSSNDLGEVTLGAGFSIVAGAITFNYGTGTTNRLAMWSGTTLTDGPIASTGTRTEFTQSTGVVPPSGTTAERSSTPAPGEWRYNETTSKGEVYLDGAWRNTSYQISATSTLDFPSTSASATSDLTITLTGAVIGEPVDLGVHNTAVAAGVIYFAWVSAADTVTVRLFNSGAGAADPALGSFTVAITK